jgi:hypothetical protein
MNTSLGENPSWVFISFLYAWLAAEIAKGFPEVLELGKDRRRRGASYLCLGAVLVGTSWTAWSLSFISGDIKAPTEVISLRTLMVIIDFAIVTLYFSFIKFVGQMRLSVVDFPQHDREHASFWVALILTMYVLWDILVWLITTDPSNMNLDNPSNKYLFWQYSWATVVCAALAWLVFYLQKKGSMRKLVESDICLVSLNLFFRALKQMSHTDEKSILRQIWPQAGPRHLTLFAFVFLVIFLVFAWLADRHKKGRKGPPPEDQAQPASATK